MVFFTQKEDPTMARRREHTEEQILAWSLKRIQKPLENLVGRVGVEPTAR